MQNLAARAFVDENPGVTLQVRLIDGTTLSGTSSAFYDTTLELNDGTTTWQISTDHILAIGI